MRSLIGPRSVRRSAGTASLGPAHRLARGGAVAQAIAAVLVARAAAAPRRRTARTSGSARATGSGAERDGAGVRAGASARAPGGPARVRRRDESSLSPRTEPPRGTTSIAGQHPQANAATGSRSAALDDADVGVLALGGHEDARRRRGRACRYPARSGRRAAFEQVALPVRLLVARRTHRAAGRRAGTPRGPWRGASSSPRSAAPCSRRVGAPQDVTRPQEAPSRCSLVAPDGTAVGRRRRRAVRGPTPRAAPADDPGAAPRPRVHRAPAPGRADRLPGVRGAGGRAGRQRLRARSRRLRVPDVPRAGGRASCAASTRCEYLAYHRGTWHGGPYDPTATGSPRSASRSPPRSCTRSAGRWALQLDGSAACSLAYFGDGCASEGDFHEGANMAGVFGAPAILFCQNNGWAISVPPTQQTVGEIGETRRRLRHARRARGRQRRAGGVRVTSEAVERAHAGEGPTLIEARHVPRSARTPPRTMPSDTGTRPRSTPLARARPDRALPHAG